jgi:thioredoxin:protein disulfide reductase
LRRCRESELVRPIILIVLSLVLLGRPAGAQPRQADIQLTPVVERAAVVRGSSIRLALQVSLPAGRHTQSNVPRDPSVIPTTLALDAPAALAIENVVFPAATDLTLPGLDQPLAVFDRQFAIGVRASIMSTAPLGNMTVRGRLRYQACDDLVCYPPRTADVQWTIRVAAHASSRIANPIFDRIAFTRGESARPTAPPSPPATEPSTADDATQLADFQVVAMTGYSDAGSFLTFIHEARTGVRQRPAFEGRGPLAIVPLVLVGGLALNLTPCVLPMIPINLAIIGAGTHAASRKRGALLGAIYGGGMAIVYGALGLVVSLGAGPFGALNASPWFNAAIALVFVVLALAMLDLVTIDFSRFTSRRAAATAPGASYALAFSMGSVAALLAGACVAPVVIDVVLFSSSLYARGTGVALALPFFLGLGMGAPWPIVGGGLASLPRPGAWMVAVKRAFAAIILVTAAYYGYFSYTLFERSGAPAPSMAADDAQGPRGWTTSLSEGLRQARLEHKPVLIDLWATWCKNCLVMDRTTLADSRVQEALAPFVRIKYQSERPDEPPVSDVMNRLGAVGLPTYVILRLSDSTAAPVSSGSGSR